MIVPNISSLWCRDLCDDVVYYNSLRKETLFWFWFFQDDAPECAGIFVPAEWLLLVLGWVNC